MLRYFVKKNIKKCSAALTLALTTIFNTKLKNKNSLTCNHLPTFLFQAIPTPLESVWKKRMEKSSSIPNQGSLIHICHKENFHQWGFPRIGSTSADVKIDVAYLACPHPPLM